MQSSKWSPYLNTALQPGNNSRPIHCVPHAGLIGSYSQHQARVDVQVGGMPCIVGAQQVAQDVGLLGEQHWFVCIGDETPHKGPLPCKGLLVAA